MRQPFVDNFLCLFQIGFLGAGGAKCTFDWSFGLIWILPNLAKSDWGFPNWLWHIYLCEGHLEYLADVCLWKIAWTHFELVCEIFVRYFHIWNISDFWHAPERRGCQTGGQYCLGRKIKIVKQRIETGLKITFREKLFKCFLHFPMSTVVAISG